MNKETQKEIPEYVKNLSKPVQDLIFDGAWEKRTEEISKKYSLNPTQTDTLINNVLFVLLGLDDPQNFTTLFTSELGISKLLAEQIIEDLEIRVFEYAVKSVQNKEKDSQSGKKPLEIPQQKHQIKEIVIPNNLPEIRPVNLPSENVIKAPEPAKIEKPAYTPPPRYVPIYKPVSAEQKPTISEHKEVTESESQGSNTERSSHINYSQNNKILEVKPVENPIQTKPAQTAASTPEIQSNQLSATPQIPKMEPEKQPEVHVDPVIHKVDPYREPIE
ncbi:hypothetical protein H0W91_01895 [Patescibacteria group bacterium]|nr:hypothetical protein [Patescibacteria group bacterium]